MQGPCEPAGYDPVPCFDIDEATHDPATRLSALSDMLRPMVDMAGLGWSGPEGIGMVRMWLLDGLILTEMKLRAHVVVRRPVHLRKYPVKTVALRMHLAGNTSNEIGIDAYRAEPGHAHLADLTELYSSIATDTHFVTATMTHETVGYDPECHPAFVRVAPPQPPDCPVVSTMKRLATDAVHRSLAEANAVAADLVGHLRVHLNEVRDHMTAPPPDEARRLQMRAFVEKSLSDPDLSAGMIAQAFGVSRATVYRELETFGGLRRYMLRRRLEEACKELAFGSGGRGAVAEAARRWQFASVPHFSRAFKQQFGISPAQAVATSLFQLAPDDPREMGKTTARGVPAWLVKI